MMMDSDSSCCVLKWGRKRLRSGPSVESRLRSPPPPLSQLSPLSPLSPSPSPPPKLVISKWKRRRNIICSSSRDLKDVCICIRLEFVDPKVRENNLNVKWLRVKIPAILVKNRGGGEDNSPISPLDLPRLSDDDYEEEHDYHYKDYFPCFVDPINGPFDFPPLVENYHIYTTWIRCAPLGSLIYALGGDPTDVVSQRDIRSQATGQVPLPNAATGGVKPPFYKRSITTSNHASHRLHLCDFSKQNPKWEISPAPLISPRIFPKLVSMEGKIYAFGGNLLTDNQSPFAEVFDPVVGYWSPLPDPPFAKLADYELLVFPLHQSSCILVIGSISDVVYTFSTSKWNWSPFHASKRLCDLLYYRGWRDDSFHPVIYDETLYWIDHLGRLCAYMLEGEGRYFVGPISVFEGEDHRTINTALEKGHTCPFALLPISSKLLGLLWCDTHYANCLSCASTLHITILYVSLLKEIDLEHGIHTNKNPVLSLTASSVACVCLPFLGDVTSVIDAYLMDDDKESWHSMNSCSSYRTIDREARYLNPGSRY